MKNEKSESKESLVSIDIWRDDPSKVRIFIEDRDIIIIPKYYLYEMKNCIDTVLGEGKSYCGNCQTHVPIDHFKTGICKQRLGQPLTEGEKCECKEMSCKDGCDRKHTCKTFWCKKCEPQESNKELVEWAYVSEKYCVVCSTGIDVRTLKLPLCDRHFKESNKEGEPSKKPSERIEEFAKNSVGFAENIGGKVDGIIKILDELHESGKI